MSPRGAAGAGIAAGEALGGRLPGDPDGAPRGAGSESSGRPTDPAGAGSRSAAGEAYDGRLPGDPDGAPRGAGSESSGRPADPDGAGSGDAAPAHPTAAGAAPRGRVAKILRSSAVDGPGNRAVVFLQGCSFNCAYCHNPETRPPVVSPKERRPDGSPAYPRLMTAAEVLAALVPAKPFIRGITVSGGECGEQPEFLGSLVEAARAAGLPALVDTNGSADYAALPALVRAAEGFMLDLKAWDPVEHRALTGAEVAPVKANLRFLAAAGKLYELRTVVAPGLFDAELTVRMAASELVALGAASTRYKLIRYRPQGVRARFKDLPEPTDEGMQALAAIARAAGLNDVILV